MLSSSPALPVMIPGRDNSRRRILFAAYAISPYHGSESAAGWNVAVRLARYHDVSVLCTSNFEGIDSRDQIESYLREKGAITGLTFLYVDPPLPSSLLQHPGGSPLRPFYYFGYASWLRAAYREAVRLHREAPFDLVHQFNLSGFREPGYLWRLNLPFVWGPVGGAPNIPWSYLRSLGWRDRFFYGARNVMNRWQMTYAYRCRKAALAAKQHGQIWAIGEENTCLVRDRWGCPSQVMLDSGAATRSDSRPRDYDGRRPLRLVWSGLHIGRKALHILLHALAKLLDKPPIELTVLGDGPLSGEWRSAVSSLGLAERVRWLGHLPHEQAVAEVAKADVFVLTSLMEGTPHVVLEALSQGLPVICHDACGMGVAINHACGLKIPLLNFQSSVDGFAEAIHALATAPAEVQRLSHGALERAQELSWDNKVEEIVANYHQLLCFRSAA